MTAFAVFFLLLDGMLLAWAGIAAGKLTFLLLSSLFFVGAGAVVVYFRRYMRALSELREARRRLLAETKAMLEVALVAGSSTVQPDSSAGDDGR